MSITHDKTIRNSFFQKNGHYQKNITQEKITRNSIIQNKSTRNNITQDKISTYYITHDKITRNLGIQDKITRTSIIQEKITKNLNIQDKFTRILLFRTMETEVTMDGRLPLLQPYFCQDFLVNVVDLLSWINNFEFEEEFLES